MAAPKIFISSTYYDLRQSRENIEAFIKSIGYEPIMHERFTIPYTQERPLVEDCMYEISECDMVIGIIGNHFGSRYMDDESASITMKEIQRASAEGKKVYLFVANDVYVENKTYIENRDSGQFKSAFTDNMEIHKFISDMKENCDSNVIAPFNTTDDIINALKTQFAGLMHMYLKNMQRDARQKEIDSLAELNAKLNQVINTLTLRGNTFFNQFEVARNNDHLTIDYIVGLLGLQKVTIATKDIEGLDEFLFYCGFKRAKIETGSFIRKYEKRTNQHQISLELMQDLCNSDGTFKPLDSVSTIQRLVLFHDETVDSDWR